MNTETIRNSIETADSLDSLCDALNSACEELRDTERTVDEIVDTSSLPTFGGSAPADTSEVWSWDATRVLIHDGNSYVVEMRDDE